MSLQPHLPAPNTEIPVVLLPAGTARIFQLADGRHVTVLAVPALIHGDPVVDPPPPPPPPYEIPFVLPDYVTGVLEVATGEGQLRLTFRPAESDKENGPVGIHLASPELTALVIDKEPGTVAVDLDDPLPG